MNERRKLWCSTNRTVDKGAIITPTRKEAIEAMQIVKDWCVNTFDCNKCPIAEEGYSIDACCVPKSWEIKE